MDEPLPLKPFGARRAILIFAGFVATQFAFGLAAGIAIGVWRAITVGLKHPSPGFLLFTAMCGAVTGAVASGFFLLVVVRAMFPAREGSPRFAALGGIRSGRGTVPAAAGAGIVLAIAVLTLIALKPPPESTEFGVLVKASMSRGPALYLWGLMAIALAPPLEELMFRGILWAGFLQSFGPRIAALLTTGLFVAMHLAETGTYWPALAGITLLGAATLSARILTRSLVPPIVLHLAYNIVICATVIAGSASSAK